MAAARRWRRGSSAVMYGRDREQTLLRELLDDAVAGHGGLVLISGEAGIGKTTLVDDLVGYADECGCLVLSGACYDLTTTPPYGPWAEAIRDYEPSDEGPDVPPWFGNPDELEKIGGQWVLFEETRGFFAAIGAIQPLVIVLEDLHWSDTASLDALRYVSRSLGDDPILIVGTYRDDEITRRDHDHLSRLLPALVREAHAARISVKPLNEDALHELIAADFELNVIDRERLVTHVANLSEGNPLYVFELLKTLDDEDVIRRVDGHHTLGKLDTVTVPPLIEQVIQRRLTRLNLTATMLLEVAAVIGQAFDFQTWWAVSEADEDALLATLDVAQRSQVIDEVTRSGRYRFHHALIREVLYERQMWPQRRKVHCRVGELLAGQPEADPDAVADHFQQAGDDRAVGWLIQAAERAERSFAWTIAIDHYSKAAQALERDPDSVRLRAELLARLGRKHTNADPNRGLDFLDEALRVLPPDPNDPLVASIRVHRGYLHCFAGRARRGIADMQTALAEYEGDAGQLTYSGGPQGHRPHEVLSIRLAAAGHLHAALEFEQSRAEHGLRWHYGSAHASALLGRLDEARTYLASDRQRLDVSPSPIVIVTVAMTEFFSIHVPYEADNLRAREQIRARGIEAQRQIAGTALGSDVLLAHSYHYFFDPDWNGLRDYIDHYGRLEGSHMQYIRALGARLAYYRGKPDDAWQEIEASLPHGTATDPGDWDFRAGTELQRVAADLCFDAGDLDEASAWLGAHDRWLDWADAVLGRAEACLGWARLHQLAGDGDRARQQTKAALHHATDPRQPLALIAIHRFIGQLDVDEGRFDSATYHLTTSLDLAVACDAPFEQARTMLVLAELANKTQDVDEARRLLAQVRAICKPLGAKPTLERADQIEARLPKRGRASDQFPAGLTLRETEILGLVAKGMTNPEVGEELFISPRTVSVHLRSIFNKLEVDSRTAAAARWVELTRS